jgi:hypothetical protein
MLRSLNLPLYSNICKKRTKSVVTGYPGKYVAEVYRR